ncbi:unnamed protein product [Nippostrongylus brasiliensis]|uniref:Purple acid phosphatase n=1 Tax=Nippostrongylus brasiliensis TaxID=27835 RepID=A0A158R0D5_NIPBR|nr:unnamed protein product [Nippostrongylus brasiliensis]
MLSILLLGLLFSMGECAPEQVHLAFHGNYSVMNVVWTTFSSDSSTVLYGTSPNSLKYTVVGTQKAWRTGSITRYSHRALMDGLQPSTQYCDISYDLHTDDGRRGDKFMNEFEPLLSRIPYMVVAGNHENDGENFTNFQERFWMPHNGYHDNQFYSFDLGPVHWVALSTEYYGFYTTVGKGPVLTQYSWLNNDLAASFLYNAENLSMNFLNLATNKKSASANRHKTPWIVSYLHRPFYCSAASSDDCSSYDNSLIRVGYEDIPGLEYPFLKYGVDLGFWGHMHFYERFYPVANKQYWSSVSSQCKLLPQRSRPNYGYTVLTVANSTHIHIEQISIDLDEAVVDDFWLSKDPGFVATDEMRYVQLVYSAPEQVHLSFRGNYSEMNVVWTTFDKDNSTLLYGSSPSSLTFSVEGSEKAWKTGGILRYTHEATMTDLLPSTTYWYRIGKRSFQFKTLPANPESFRVCVFGDLGYEHGHSTASIIRNGMAGMFDFIIHIAYDLHSDAGRTGDKFMNVLEPVISRNAVSNRQRTPWIVSYLHRPFYCSSKGNNDCSDSDSALIRVGDSKKPGLEEVFLKYRLDVGFWGHKHFYERFYPVANGTYWNGGCHSSGTFDKHPTPFSAKRTNQYGYTIMTVANATHIHLEQISIDLDEAVVDDLWLRKDIGSVTSEREA